MAEEHPRWTVLVVDDNPGFAGLIRRALQHDPRFLVIASAGDGAEGVALADAYQPDVVILDDVMPVMSGLNALPELRRSSPNSVVILFSANLNDAVSERAVELGADAVASKLEPIVIMLRTIARLLNER